MTINVNDILNQDFMTDAKLVAGKMGVKREIKYVDIIEVPDIYGWIREGGFFLTTGYSIKDDISALKKIINYLDQNNSAALCIKRGRYINKISKEIIKLANNLEFPLIELDKEVSYVDILLPLTSKILDKQTYLLKRSEKIQDELTKVVLSGGGLDHLSQTLHDLINRSVLIQGLKQEILSFVGNNKNINDKDISIPKQKLRKRINNNNLFKDEKLSRLIAPVKVSDNVLGYVSIFEANINKIEKIDCYALQHAANIIAIKMLKEREQSEIEKRLKVELLNDILQENYSSKDNLINRALNFNWNLNKEYLTIILKVNNNDKSLNMQNTQESITKILKSELIKNVKDIIIINKSSYFVIFYNCTDLNKEESKKAALRFSKKINNNLLTKIPELNFILGIGGHYQGVDGLKKSYNQADQAIDISEKIQQSKNVYHYDDLGIYKILVELNSKELLSEFYYEVLGPLADEDNQELLNTMEELLSSFGNKKIAADKLNIHRNTIDYRIKKMNKLLDLDMGNKENWLKIYLAYKIKEII